MQIFLIDAFNLIHKIGSMSESATPHNDLIQYLHRRRLTGSAKNRVAVVFDGHEPRDCPAGGNFKIHFSNNRPADHVIKSMIDREHNKKNIVVVSDDREIRNYAGISGAQVCRPKEFLASKRKEALRTDDDREITCSEMADITEDLERKWIK